MRCPNCQQEMPEATDRCPACGHDRVCLPPGRLLDNGKYRIEAVLGRGGFGITYHATDLMMDRAVAIKELFPSSLGLRETTSGRVAPRIDHDDEFRKSRERFLKEGRRLAALHVPRRVENVVYVHTIFEDNGTAYLVMELLHGTTLHQILRIPRDGQGNPLPPARIQTIMDGLVRALTAIHRADLTHLDIKPANIVIAEHDTPILIDFGSARPVGGPTTSVVSGSADYAPPELWAGGEVGPESDLYELGRTLYEMVTGRSSRYRKEGDLAEPWESLVASATRLDRFQRPRSAEIWWQSAKGAIKPSHPRSAETTFVPLTKDKRHGQPARPIPYAPIALGVAILAGGGLIMTTLNRESGKVKPTPTTKASVRAVPTPKGGAPPNAPKAPTAPGIGNPETEQLVGLLNRLRDQQTWRSLRPQITKAIRNGANPDASAHSGPFSSLTALHWAAAMGDSSLVTLLSDEGANIDVQGKEGDTPLHQAAAAGQAGIVGQLLAEGADANRKNRAGQTPADKTSSSSLRRLLRQGNGGGDE
jgi:serine/threonine protein kinase